MCNSIMQTSVGRSNAERMREAEAVVKEKKISDAPEIRKQAKEPEVDFVRLFSGLNLRGC